MQAAKDLWEFSYHAKDLISYRAGSQFRYFILVVLYTVLSNLCRSSLTDATTFSSP